MDNARSRVAPSAGIVLVATLISNYVISQFLRNSIGVIAPDLARDLDLSAAEIGLLSSVFFLVFAAVQLPLGIALDRFGPRLCLLTGAVITVLGSVVFATAATPVVLIFGRVLLGLGTAGSLIAALAVYAERFPPRQFATLAGLHVGVGTVGTLIATAPLAQSSATIGWRGSFLAVGIVTLTIGLVMTVVVDDRGGTHRRESLHESLAGMLAVLRTPSVGPLLAINLVFYSTFSLVAGLWGGPYLAHIYGYGLEQRGNLLLVPVLTQIIGSVAWGPMQSLTGSYRLPVLVGAIATAALLLALAVVGTLGHAALIAWLAVFGFVSAYGPLVIAHGKALFPPHQVGRGLTLLNMGTMGGTFLSQVVSGYLIELFPAAPDGAYALDAYRLVFGLQGAAVLLACLIYTKARDPVAEAAHPASHT